MKRPTRALLVAGALLVTGPAMQPHVATAQTVDQQRQEVERIVDELERLEERSDILTEDYVVAVDEKNRLDVEVAAAQERVAAKEAELTELRGDLATVAVRAFTGSGTDVLGPLFASAGSYTDTLQRDQLARVALSVGTVTTDDLDALVAELAAEREDLADKSEQAQALAEQIADQQSDTDALRAEYQQRRAEAEATLGQLIAEEEQRRAEEAYRRLVEQAAAPAGGGGTSGGGQTQVQAAPAGGNAPAPAPAPSGGTSSDGATSTPAAPAPAPAPAPAASYPAPSGLAGAVISAALAQVGVPYRYASSSPGVAFDCSGLTHYAWAQAGVNLPRNSRAQSGVVTSVPVSQAQPGDLIFYYSPISHVGIYLGGGQLVHAPNTGKTVSVANVNWGKVVMVGRPG
jgi:peptidoglycan DL-endopeptidase CwlO